MRLGAQPFSWKWELFEWEWKMISISKAGGWVSLGKNLEFKSSEMTKNVSIIHKVERSFIYFVQYSLWKSYSYWPCSFSKSDCPFATFRYFGKFKLFGWKKFIYGYRCSWLRSLLDIIINGEGFFAKFCFLVCFLFPCLYTDMFFFRYTCVRAWSRSTTGFFSAKHVLKSLDWKVNSSWCE